METATILDETPELAYYLCPERKISFDGFVNYEGRRFGVPYWYSGKTCRVQRDGYTINIYDIDMTKLLVSHDVTWSRRDRYCKDQFAVNRPEEHPSSPVTTHIHQMDPVILGEGFDRFRFGFGEGA